MTRLLLASLLLSACAAPHTPDVTRAGEGRVTSGHLLRDREAPPPRPRKAASRSRAPITRTGTLLNVTAYCPTGHRTASGLRPREGMAAGNGWPFGTRLHVEGVGVVTVQDRIGWGSQLDLFRDSCADARRFGRRHLRVAVLR